MMRKRGSEMTENLKTILNEIAEFTHNSNHAIQSEEDSKWFEEWYREGVNESVVQKAFTFYKNHKSNFDLRYPPYYVKGKNGAYYESVCYVPEQDGYEDYAYYKGTYVNLFFTRQEIFVFVDGKEMEYFGSLQHVIAYFENAEEQTGFESFLRGQLGKAQELFKAFMA